MQIVSCDIENDIGFITVNNPPVNALSQAVRQGLFDCIAEIAEMNVRAAVIICEGRTFMAGADIREFGKPPEPPHLPDLVQKIEDSRIPVVAAIHGNALGGGLEIALGCHYRIADHAAKVGLPEVKLGLLPGAGGTQRLPRLVGAQAALDMITTGVSLDAERARKLGLIDLVVEMDLRQAAVAFVKNIANEPIEERQLSRRKPESVADGFFDRARQLIKKRKRGLQAPVACVDAIEGAYTLPFPEGMKQERKLFLECRASDQSSAQRYLFFAERECAKIPGLTKHENPLKIQNIGIIGGGTMGSGIAMTMADAGLNVTLVEMNAQALDTAMERIGNNYHKLIGRGNITYDEKILRVSRISGTTCLKDISHMDLVIEAVFEKMDIKQQIFHDLDKVCRQETILATNTSYLDVNAIASATERPENVIGLHFFSPANIMKLLEIVRGDKTADNVLSGAMHLARKIGKIGVLAGVCHGFIGNRMYQCYQREAGLLMLEGANPDQIDNALYTFGMPMGPLKVADLAGLDIGYMMRQSLQLHEYEPMAFEVHDRLVESGRKGQKTGAGFYDYTSDAKGVFDLSVVDIIARVAARHGIQRKPISDEEIVNRCILALVNEGMKILDEAIAIRASDIDVVYCNGYGFPRYRGGPMYYARHLGFDKVLAMIKHYSETVSNRWWQPASLLVRAADDPSLIQ